jgi:hypothetical protein
MPRSKGAVPWRPSRASIVLDTPSSRRQRSADEELDGRHAFSIVRTASPLRPLSRAGTLLLHHAGWWSACRRSGLFLRRRGCGPSWGERRSTWHAVAHHLRPLRDGRRCRAGTFSPKLLRQPRTTVGTGRLPWPGLTHESLETCDSCRPRVSSLQRPSHGITAPERTGSRSHPTGR